MNRACLLTAALLALAGGAAADPMRPLAAPVSAASAAAASGVATANVPRDAAAALPALLAIRTDGGASRALLGEQWVGVGDRVGQRRITAIGDNHVDASDGRRHARIYLLPPLQPALPPRGAAAR